VAARPGPRDFATLAMSWRLGVRPRSLTTIAQLALGAITKRVPRERLRAAQFLMQADIFQALTWKHDPDLAVLFTNHVASMMHRYWYAAFPGDWAGAVYDQAWIDRYRNEVAIALHLLDHTIAELRTFCEATGRALIVTSSIGQAADTDHAEPAVEFAVVRDADRFVGTLSDSHVAVLAGMVPQVSIVHASTEDALRAKHAIEAKATLGIRFRVDQAAEVLTLTYEIDPAARSFTLDGRTWSFSEAGIEVHPVDDHRSGRHDPVGSLIVNGLDLEAAVDGDPADVLHVAPTILDALGVEPPAYHRASLLSVTSEVRA
jgi:hypothetical protein